MTAARDDPSAVDAFALLAERYRALVDGREALGADAFLRGVHAMLPALYSAALALQAVEAVDGADDDEDDGAGEEGRAGGDDGPGAEGGAGTLPTGSEPPADRLGTEAWMALYRALGAFLAGRNHYAEVFDPFAEPPEEAVTGSLADDLADIYNDLGDGLAKWRRGESAAALWAWRVLFTAHWGEHAASALRALHALAAAHDLGFPAARSADV